MSSPASFAVHPKEKGSSGCGCVVFSNDLQRIVLVESKRTNNWCPPKGGRERCETTTVAALRELREEAGLLPSDIELIPDCFVDEVSAKGVVLVRYRIARLRSTHDARLSCDNPKEILQQGFYALAHARELLSNQRKTMLDVAILVAQRAFNSTPVATTANDDDNKQETTNATTS